jgi:hypothetical protein
MRIEDEEKRHMRPFKSRRFSFVYPLLAFKGKFKGKFHGIFISFP